MRILLLVLGLGAVVGFSGCASWFHRHPKPQTHIYSGDSPGFRRIDDRPEVAGGELHTY